VKQEQQELWQKLRKPFDKEAYKEVSFGQRKFTAIDAYHIIERLTDVFGLCGTGWGVEVERFEQDKDNIAAVGFIWYVVGDDTMPAKVRAVGDGKVMSGNIAEGMKKATTNLISKAASYIGIGLSVYQGLGIDDPYLDRAAESRKPRAPGGIDKATFARLVKAGAAVNVTADQICARVGKARGGEMTEADALEVEAWLNEIKEEEHGNG